MTCYSLRLGVVQWFIITREGAAPVSNDRSKTGPHFLAWYSLFPGPLYHFVVSGVLHCGARSEAVRDTSGSLLLITADAVFVATGASDIL